MSKSRCETVAIVQPQLSSEEEDEEFEKEKEIPEEDEGWIQEYNKAIRAKGGGVFHDALYDSTKLTGCRSTFRMIPDLCPGFSTTAPAQSLVLRYPVPMAIARPPLSFLSENDAQHPNVIHMLSDRFLEARARGDPIAAIRYGFMEALRLRAAALARIPTRPLNKKKRSYWNGITEDEEEDNGPPLDHDCAVPTDAAVSAFFRPTAEMAAALHSVSYGQSETERALRLAAGVAETPDSIAGFEFKAPIPVMLRLTNDRSIRKKHGRYVMVPAVVFRVGRRSLWRIRANSNFAHARTDSARGADHRGGSRGRIRRRLHASQPQGRALQSGADDRGAPLRGRTGLHPDPHRRGAGRDAPLLDFVGQPQRLADPRAAGVGPFTAPLQRRREGGAQPRPPARARAPARLPRGRADRLPQNDLRRCGV